MQQELKESGAFMGGREWKIPPFFSPIKPTTIDNITNDIFNTSREE